MTTTTSAATGDAAPDDQALVERIVGRDVSALASLYDRHSPLLLALARRILGETSDAEEVLQEVFLQVWNQAARYQDDRSSVSTWLVLLTRSRAIDRLRGRQSRDRTLSALREEKPGAYTSASAFGNVLTKERKRRLREELGALPQEQRQVLELAFYGGLSQSEISEQAEIPLGTVKTRTLLAMRKLRSALEGEKKDLL